MWSEKFKTARGKLTQAEAAAALTIDPGEPLSVRTVEDWECGRSQPRGWVQELVLEKLSGHLGATSGRVHRSSSPGQCGH